MGLSGAGGDVVFTQDLPPCLAPLHLIIVADYVPGSAHFCDEVLEGFLALTLSGHAIHLSVEGLLAEKLVAHHSPPSALTDKKNLSV